MYLYFNKQGDLTTIIPHGERVRQGSNLNIYVLFDEDFFSSKGEKFYDWNVNVKIITPDNKAGLVMIPSEEPIKEVFEKTIDSEVVYDLIEGQTYWKYTFNFTPQQATMKFGKINTVISILKTVGESEGAEVEEIQYVGKAEIYVERTFGFSIPPELNITPEQYEQLMVLLNNLDSRKVSRQEFYDRVYEIGLTSVEFIQYLEEHYFVDTDLLDMGDVENFDGTNDKQIPTSKAVNEIVPLVVDEVLILPVSHDNIKVGYRNSIDLDSLNKMPQEGEKFWGICKTDDNYLFSFVARCTGEFISSGNIEFAVFEFIEVSSLYGENIIDLGHFGENIEDVNESVSLENIKQLGKKIRNEKFDNPLSTYKGTIGAYDSKFIGWWDAYYVNPCILILSSNEKYVVDTDGETVYNVSKSVYATQDDLTKAIPTKISQLINDKGYVIHSELEQYATQDDLTKAIPTKTSQLENDSNFIDNTVNNLVNYYLKTETYTKDEVKALVNAINTLTMKVVTELPTTDISTTTIYLKLKVDGESPNIYEEYIYINGNWEMIGTTDIDLSGYALKTEIPTKTSQLENDSGYVVEGLLSRYMTRDTTQTISGNKIFESPIYFWDETTYIQRPMGGTAIEFYITDNLALSIRQNYLKVYGTIGTEDSYIPGIFGKMIKGNVIYQNNKQVANKEDIPTKLSQLEIDMELGVNEDDVLAIIDSNSEETTELEVFSGESIAIGTSESYDVTSDEEIPTTKTVVAIINARILTAEELDEILV